MIDCYGVIGNPVSQSKSPQIHRAFAAQIGDTIEYRRIETTPDRFTSVVTEFLKGSGRGLSVTMPFKLQAFALMDALSERARRAGAVNMISRREDDCLIGDNTDGEGLVTDLQENLGWMIQGRRVLVLGAGGASRGILGNLLEEKPSVLVLANRTRQKAGELARQFLPIGPIEPCGLEEAVDEFDLVVNATGASLAGSPLTLHPSIIGAQTNCYDLAYAKKDTPFVQWAKQHGATRAVDGLGMLVEQACLQFEGWRGHHPDTAPVLEALRSEQG